MADSIGKELARRTRVQVQPKCPKKDDLATIFPIVIGVVLTLGVIIFRVWRRYAFKPLVNTKVYRPENPMKEVLSKPSHDQRVYHLSNGKLTLYDAPCLMSFSVHGGKVNFNLVHENATNLAFSVQGLVKVASSKSTYDLSLTPNNIAVRIHRNVKAAGFQQPPMIAEFEPNQEQRPTCDSMALRIGKQDGIVKIYYGNSLVAAAEQIPKHTLQWLKDLCCFWLGSKKTDEYALKIAADCDSALIAWSMFAWIDENSSRRSMCNSLYIINFWAFATVPVDIVKACLKDNEAIASGQLWRLVTPMFLHAGWIHVIANNLALSEHGNNLEIWCGSQHILYLYIWSGILGILFSYVFEPTKKSLGASGAVYGLCAARLVFNIRNRNTLQPSKGLSIFHLMYIWILVQEFKPQKGVSLAAHAGGFIGGIIFSLVAGPRLFEKEERFNESVLENRPFYKSCLLWWTRKQKKE